MKEICAVLVDQSMVNFVRSASCEHDMVRLNAFCVEDMTLGHV